MSDTGADEGGSGIPVASDAGTSARAAEVTVGGSANVMSTGARMPMSLESNMRADESIRSLLVGADESTSKVTKDPTTQSLQVGGLKL